MIAPTAEALVPAVAAHAPAHFPRAGHAAAQASPASALAPAEWHGFAAHRLANEHLEVVIVPALGRVMHFSWPGGRNFLWTDPEALAEDRLTRYTRYAFWGGDKTWLAPQDDWPALLGAPWPPDPAWGDAAAGPHTASPLADDSLRVTGPVSAANQLRLSRHYRLDGDDLVITSAVENHGPAPREIALWNVTNVPRPDRVYFLPVARSDYADGYRIFPFVKNPAALARAFSLAAPLLAFSPAAAEGPLKIGLDGEVAALVARFGDDYFLQRGERPPGRYLEGSPGRAGLCVEYFDTGAATVRPFAELELLGPAVLLAPGARAQHSVRWSLVRGPSTTQLHTLMEKPVPPVPAPPPTPAPPTPVAFRADDAGASPGINAGILDALRAGTVRNVSVIAIGPAFAEFAAQFRALTLDPAPALGLHVALNCEWLGQSWRPLAPPAEIPGLVDDKGLLLHRHPHEIEAAAVPLAQLLREVRAQLAALRAAGLHPVYLDEHMGVGWIDGGALRRALIALCTEEGLVYADALPRVSSQLLHAPFEPAATETAAGGVLITHPAQATEDTLALRASPDDAPGRHAKERAAETTLLLATALREACALGGPLRSLTIPEFAAEFAPQR